MIEEAVFQALISDSAIHDKVGVGSTHNVFPLRLPDSVDLSNGYAITYTQINEAEVYPALRQLFIQFNCFGDTFEKARDLANDVDRVLNGLSETSLGGTFEAHYVKFERRQALYDAEAKLWYVVMEFSIKH